MKPRDVTWTNPTERVDNTPFDSTTETAGYELALDSAPAISIPIGYATSYDLTQLSAYADLKTGTHSATLAITDKEGNTSAPSAPATFRVALAPLAPTALAVVA
jgi:hypothetical protein